VPSSRSREPSLATPTPREPFLEEAFDRSADGHGTARPRRHARLLAWAAAVVARLQRLGYETSASAIADERGLERVVFVQAAPRHDGQCSRIALSLGEGAVEVAIELSSAEGAAIRERTTDPVWALQLTTALESLPEQFAIAVAGEAPQPLESLGSTDGVRALFERVAQGEHAVWLGWRIGRDVAVSHAELLDEQLEDAIVALGSVFTILTLAPDGASATRGSRRIAKGRTALGSSRREDAAEWPLREDGRRDKARARERERTQEGHDRDIADPESDGRQTEGPAAGSARASSPRNASAPSARSRSGREIPPPPPKRAPAGSSAHAPIAGRGKVAPSRKAAAIDPRDGQLQKGSRVRVLEGPFSGKVGVVQQVDGKGGARVMLGLLAVRFDVRELGRCAEGRGRPVLSSSHRKPVPVRS
jgi:KOW motif